jgi:hypothetical protein
LTRLIVKTLLLPDHTPLADVPYIVRQSITFANVHVLRTRTTASMAPKLLSWTPRVAEPALGIVDAVPPVAARTAARPPSATAVLLGAALSSSMTARSMP